MVIMSLTVGIPFNGESNFLYTAEFTNTFRLLKDEALTPLQIIIWILLLITHFVVISLLFLTQKSYFRDLLIIAPASFLLIYIAHASLAIIFLLLPFIILWIVALIKQNKTYS